MTISIPAFVLVYLAGVATVPFLVFIAFIVDEIRFGR